MIKTFLQYIKRKDSVIAIAIFAFFLTFYCLFISNFFHGYDIESILTSHAIYEKFEVKIPTGVTGIDGGLYFRGGISHPILQIPFAILFNETIEDLGLGGKVFNAFVIAIIIPATYLLLRFMNFKTRTAIITSFIAGLTTMLLPYARIGMEGVTAFTLFFSFLCYFVYSRKKTSSWLIAGSIFNGLLFASKGYAFGFSAILFIYLISILYSHDKKFYRNPKTLALAILPFLPFALANIWFNIHRYNNWLFGAYNDGPGRTMPIFIGIFGLILGFGKSFLFYNATVFLGIFGFKSFYKQYKAEAIFIVGLTSIFLIYISRYWLWTDEPWGPRYLLAFVPLWSLLAAPVIEKITSYKYYKRLLIVLVILFGLIANLTAVIYTYENTMEILDKHKFAYQENYQFIPQLSTFYINLQQAKSLILRILTGESMTYTFLPVYTIYSENQNEGFEESLASYDTRVRLYLMDALKNGGNGKLAAIASIIIAIIIMISSLVIIRKTSKAIRD